MHFVLDANEYIFALGLAKQEKCELLVNQLVEKISLHSFSICRTIVEEVRANLTPKDFQHFIRLINIISTVDEDFLVPFELGARYERQGFKEADAFIAAYTEWAGADALVSENRHFLTRHPNLPFKVLTAEQCLKLM